MLTIEFAATSAGTATGDLVVTYDNGQTRTAGLTGLALSTSMSLTPDGDIDFGPVCSGQTAQKEFSIHANDLGLFEVNTISTPDVPFTVTAPPLPANVQGNPGNTVTFTVAAAPTAAGHQVSTMMVDTDIPGGTPHTLNLAVDGLDAGVSAIPASVDFGANPIQTTTIGQEIHLSNCSGAAITAMNARIESRGRRGLRDRAAARHHDDRSVRERELARRAAGAHHRHQGGELCRRLRRRNGHGAAHGRGPR